jgi:hypothetical protein
MRVVLRLLLPCVCVLGVGCDKRAPPIEFDAGVPPVESLKFDPCSARNPVTVVSAEPVAGPGGIQHFDFDLPVDVPLCVRIDNRQTETCSRPHRRDRGGGGGRGNDDDDDDDDDDGDDDDDDDDGDDDDDDDDDDDHGCRRGRCDAGGAGGGTGTSGGGTGTSGGGSSGTGGAGGASCSPNLPVIDVALDRTLLVRHQAYEPLVTQTAQALETSAGPHKLRVKFHSARGTRVSIRVQVPGPVVDSISPPAAEPGSRLTFTGEGYYGPLSVTAGSTSLANPTALSFDLASADTVPGISSGPLTLTTVFGAASGDFTPLAARPALTEEAVALVPVAEFLGSAVVVIPEVRFLALKRGSEGAADTKAR